MPKTKILTSMAAVFGDGTLDRSHNGINPGHPVTVTRLDVGDYQVNFHGKDLQNAFFYATLGTPAREGTAMMGGICAELRFNDYGAVFVRTYGLEGEPLDNSFFLHVELPVVQFEPPRRFDCCCERAKCCC